MEQQTTSPVNNTCTYLAESEVIEKLSKRPMDIELKYISLESKYYEFYHARNKTNQRINEVLQEVSVLRNLTVHQTLNSFKNELLTINATTNHLESSSHARSQDILAFNRSLHTTANYVTTNTLSIRKIQYYMNISETIEKLNRNTTKKSLKKWKTDKIKQIRV